MKIFNDAWLKLKQPHNKLLAQETPAPVDKLWIQVLAIPYRKFYFLQSLIAAWVVIRRVIDLWCPWCRNGARCSFDSYNINLCENATQYKKCEFWLYSWYLTSQFETLYKRLLSIISLEIKCTARYRGFESHRLRHKTLGNAKFSRVFLFPDKYKRFWATPRMQWMQ